MEQLEDGGETLDMFQKNLGEGGSISAALKSVFGIMLLKFNRPI